MNKKALCEFSHELLIQPEVIQELNSGYKLYKVHADNTEIQYEFKAKPMALNHLMIDESSIRRYVKDIEEEVDAITFIKDC